MLSSLNHPSTAGVFCPLANGAAVSCRPALGCRAGLVQLELGYFPEAVGHLNGLLRVSVVNVEQNGIAVPPSESLNRI